LVRFKQFGLRWFSYGSRTVNKLTVWFVNHYNGSVIFGSARFDSRSSVQFMVLFAHPKNYFTSKKQFSSTNQQRNSSTFIETSRTCVFYHHCSGFNLHLVSLKFLNREWFHSIQESFKPNSSISNLYLL